MKLNRKRVLVAVLALLIVASGAAAYTTVFTASSGTSYETDSGLKVATSVDHGLDDANPFNGTDEVYINDLSVTASGDAAVTIDQFEGATTQLSGIDASSNTVTVDPGDKPSVDISGSVTDLSYSDASLEDDEVALTYSASDSGTITMTDLEANEDWTAATTDGELVDNGTTNSEGDASIDVDSATDEDVILFTNHAPSFDADSADSGSGRERTLSIDASDPEFSTEQGDELDVEFFVREPDESSFSSAGTDTLTSNGTAATSYETDLGGTHDWYAVANDSYGASTDSETQSFNARGQLFLRNETDAGQLVTETNVTVRWFGTDEVYQDTTNDGVIDMAGLPTEDFTVQVDADGYHSRTVYITDLNEQQSVYLLNENESSVETRFQLNDPTGLFPSQSTLYISKPIERNGTVEYRTVYADQFGTEGVTAELMEGERYRLRIESPDGQTQDLGPYRADVGESVEIRPEGAAVEVDELSGGWGTNAQLSNRTLTVEYSDPSEETDSLEVTIYERGNESNQLQASESYTDLGNLSSTYTLSENESEKEWVVEYDISRGGESFTREEIVANNPGLVLSGLSDAWTTIFGVGILFVFAGIFSVLNVGVGAIMLALVGGLLWWTGWLAATTSGAAVVIYLFIAVLYSIYRSGGP